MKNTKEKLKFGFMDELEIDLKTGCMSAMGEISHKFYFSINKLAREKLNYNTVEAYKIYRDIVVKMEKDYEGKA